MFFGRLYTAPLERYHSGGDKSRRNGRHGHPMVMACQTANMPNMGQRGRRYKTS
jgi:hypothetical protein